MAFIRWVEDEQAQGPLAEGYARWKKNNPTRARVPQILKCFSPRPDLFQSVLDVSYNVHFQDGFLTRRHKEMIATFVSGLNRCPY